MWYEKYEIFCYITKKLVIRLVLKTFSCYLMPVLYVIFMHVSAVACDLQVEKKTR